MPVFESTLPEGAPNLMRVSGFRRYLHASTVMDPLDRPSVRLSSLSPSLLQDLLRFERGGLGSELLEVLAASRRHGRSLLIHLQLDAHVLPLTVFPAEQLAHCPMPASDLLASRLNALTVIHVEPALLHPPSPRSPPGDAAHFMQLAPLSWALALRGSRDALLPELAVNAAYRLQPGADLRSLALGGALAAGVARLRRETTNLRDMTAWPGFNAERARRLLNGLYLQAALIVSRSHPAATNEAWRSSRGPA